MTKEEVKQLLKQIQGLYPNFTLTEEIAKVWIYLLKTADNELTTQKLIKHYQTNKYAPHVSEIMVLKEINPAAIQYQMIQEEIQRNKQQAKDPEKQKLIDANLKKIRGALIDE